MTDATAQAADAPPPARWAKVEIMGHRKHYGRISEVSQFGAAMIQIDVPLPQGSAQEFVSFQYGGAAIFGITPMTEEAVRAWAAEEWRYETPPLALMPPRWAEPAPESAPAAPRCRHERWETETHPDGRQIDRCLVCGSTDFIPF